MKFISFEDTTGIYETVLFPKVYDRYCHMLNKTRPYILKGKVEETFGAVNLRVDWLGFLDWYKVPTPKRQKRTIPDRPLFALPYTALKNILDKVP